VSGVIPFVRKSECFVERDIVATGVVPVGLWRGC
jgi:hypothetical protein